METTHCTLELNDVTYVSYSIPLSCALSLIQGIIT